MSKIGKINIPIPDKVKVLLSGNIVNICLLYTSDAADED